MLGARRKMEEIGFMKPGEQPYFHAGAAVHVLGFAEPPKGTIWDPVTPSVVLAGHLARPYAPGEDALLSGPMARTVHVGGTERIYNLFGLLCGLNAFAQWRGAKDEHGCLLYVLINDGTRALPGEMLLTDLIEAEPPVSAQAREDYERRIAKAACAHLFDNAMYIETSLAWTR